MYTYKSSPLQKYIDNSIVININKYFKIRIAENLEDKYKTHIYDKGINHFANYVEQIRNLDFKYPGNANPIFYMYIVPNKNFKEILGFPENLDLKGGGRPVYSYDLDGFPYAYGVSSNIIEERNNPNIMQNTNSIHEFAHLLHSLFFQFKNKFISEGLAEAITFYTLDYESKFNEHRNCIKELAEDKILSAKELIQAENNFDTELIIPNTSCSFRITYISSYLFIRCCIETIEKKFNLNRIKATQKLLEMLRVSANINEWLVFDIANAIGVPQDELLYEKKLQFNIVKKLP